MIKKKLIDIFDSLKNKYGNNRNVIVNILWLLADKIFRMGGGLLVGLMVARYLGTEKFGVFNFVYSFPWLFSFLVTLGLDEIVVREIVVAPEKKSEILATSFFLKVFGAVASVILIMASLIFVTDISQYSTLFIGIMSSAMIIKTVDVFRLWFDSQVQSKFVVLAENLSFVITAILKVIFVLYYFAIEAFVWLTLVEILLAGLILIYFYFKKNDFSGWTFNKNLAKKMLLESWPLIIASLSITIYVKSDIVLLGLLSTEEEVGIYGAVTRISEIWYFLPTTIVVSTFPSIMSARQSNPELYKAKLQKLFNIMTIGAIAIAIPVTFLSSWLMQFLYGNAYAAGGNVLAVHVWACVFVFLGVASSKFFVAENLLKNQFYRTIIGAILNIVLNIILIPKLGSLGSAIATVISYGISVFSAILFRKTYQMTLMMLSSFNFYKIYKDFKKHA